MNSFGLGLVLNFTDNASSGMRRVSQTFNEMNGLASQMVDSSNSAVYSIETLTAAGIGLSVAGENLNQMGTSILSLFTGITQSVIDTGNKMLGFRMQLQALYGEDLYEQKMQEIQAYAKDSVFEVEGLMSAVTVMKAVGIEAMDEITSSSGNTTQKLLDYASDIAAMVPNMRNAYGTGVNAAMGALKEYIAEGNAMSLKRGAGFDITGILGEDKGATIEERTQQVADLVEQLGIAGYTASLVGTPTQQLAKIQDTLFNTMSAISDSGVFDSYTKLLTKAATWIETLTSDTEKYNTIVALIGDTISTIMKPLNYLLDGAIKVVDAFIDFAATNPKIAKSILVAVAGLGAFLVVLGTVLKFAGSFFLLTSSFTQMSVLAKRGISIFTVFGNAVKIVISKFIPFVALATTLYTVWSKNLFGIRDAVTQVFSDIGTVLSLVSDAWADNTLSVDDFNKATNLGVLPFIEAMLDLKYLLGNFADGFSQGFQSVFDTLDSLLGKISPVNDTVYSLTNKIGTFLKDVLNVPINEGSWTKVGEIFGKIAGALAIVIPLVFGAVKAFSLVKGVIALVTTPVGWVVLAIAAVVAAVAGLKYAWDNNLGGIQEKTKAVFEKILGFYNTYIAPFVDKVKIYVGNIITIVKNLWESWLKPIFEQIGGFFTRLWTNIMQPYLSKVGSFIGSVVRFVGMVINVLMDLYNNVIAPIVNYLVTVLAPAVNSVVQIVLGIIEYVYTTITDIIGGILTALGGVLDFITGIFTGDWELAWQGICNIFKGIWETLGGIVKGVVNGIILVINTLISSVYSVIAGVINGVGSIFGFLAGALGFDDAGFSVPETAPQIPYLAEGGVAVEATPAVIGEGEDDEAILPLNTKVFSEIAKGINRQVPANNQPPVQNDYSVTFGAGSIIIQLANATDAELERAAEKLMKIIERKQKLKAMAVRA